MNPKLNTSRFPFIHDKFSPLFNRVFYWYTYVLFRRRFQCVWLDDSGHPPGSTSALFIGNHNSWWDGLIPLLVNEKVYGLKGRAMMDEDQLKKMMFFRRLGTFSINRSHPRKAMRSLQYAAKIINNAKPGRGIGLWMYPEGKLVSPETPIKLESGLMWLSRKLDPEKCEIIPFATHIHCLRGDKPELFIKIGNPMGPAIFRSGFMLAKTTRILEELRASCREQSGKFDPSGKPEKGFRLLVGNNPHEPKSTKVKKAETVTVIKPPERYESKLDEESRASKEELDAHQVQR